MPQIIGKRTTVVDLNGLNLTELLGNVATNTDNLSVAYVTITPELQVPLWNVIQFTEYYHVVKGTIEIHSIPSNTNADNSTTTTTRVVVTAGETCRMEPGERFRPVYPKTNTTTITTGTDTIEYIAICQPAFRLDRIQQYDDNTIMTTVDDAPPLSTTSTSTTATTTTITLSDTNTDDNDYVYHMCQKVLWDDAVTKEVAYYPPTFEQDGNFIHATKQPEQLLMIANHYYQSTIGGDWICLQINTTVLQKRYGIITKYEQPKPVGEIATPKTYITTSKEENRIMDDKPDEIKEQEEQEVVIFPHIYGGIPTFNNDNGMSDTIIHCIYPMERNNETGEFLCIQGLTN